MLELTFDFASWNSSFIIDVGGMVVFISVLASCNCIVRRDVGGMLGLPLIWQAGIGSIEVK